MPTSHLKRIAAPKSWAIARKETKYIMRPRPGPHRLEQGMPLSVAIRELIKVAKAAKEAKQIIKLKDVFVDKRKRTDEKYPVGLMDIIEFPQLEEQYRILFDRKGNLTAVKADTKEASTKLARIESKSKAAGGKIQLHLSDGRNITEEKDDYRIGDTLQLGLPEQRILNHMKLDKGAMLMLVGGKHTGMIATAEEVAGDKIIIKAGKGRYEVKKEHAFVIGAEKPALDSIRHMMAEKVK
jgi:small subunit ribosomal protein S4e